MIKFYLNWNRWLRSTRKTKVLAFVSSKEVEQNIPLVKTTMLDWLPQDPQIFTLGWSCVPPSGKWTTGSTTVFYYKMQIFLTDVFWLLFFNSCYFVYIIISPWQILTNFDVLLIHYVFLVNFYHICVFNLCADAKKGLIQTENHCAPKYEVSSFALPFFRWKMTSRPKFLLIQNPQFIS